MPIMKFDGMEITSKNDINDWLVRSRAVKLKISKSIGDIFCYLEKAGFPIAKCAFCGRHNSKFGIITSLLDDNDVMITGIEYKIATNPNGIKNYCFTKGDCSGKLLNPNSKAFLSKVHGISADDALIMIHNRSSSPFYKTSFDSEEEYKKSQSRGEEWRNKVGITKEEQGAATIKGRSIEAYKDRYGDEWEDVKLRHNKSKSHTEETFIARYGTDGSKKFKEYTDKINFSLESFKYRYGSEGIIKYVQFWAKRHGYEQPVVTKYDLALFTLFYLSRTSLSTLVSFPFDDSIAKSKAIMASLDMFNMTSDELKDLCKEHDPIFMSIPITKFPIRSKYGYIFYSEDGVLFRSKQEFDVYMELMNIGFKPEDIEIDKCYPNSMYRYDFYIAKLNMFIEVAGLLGHTDYDTKMAIKDKLFEPLVITNSNLQTQLTHIREQYESRNELH